MSSAINSGSTAAVPFVGGYNANVETLIASYLQGTQVVEMAKDGAPFASNAALSKMAKLFEVFANEDAECLRQGFDQRMIAVFSAQNLSLWRLPVFDISIDPKSGGDHFGVEDFPLLEDGTKPGLMRFKGNKQNVGFIFHIRKKVALDTFMPDETVFAMHAPYPRKEGEDVVWINDGVWAGYMFPLYRNAHEPDHKGDRFDYCKECPHFARHNGESRARVLERFVQNEDPLFTLAGKIAQVESPLPLLEAPVQAQPVVAQPAAPQAPSGVRAFIRRFLGMKE